MYVINEPAIRRRARRLGYRLQKQPPSSGNPRTYRLVFDALGTIALGVPDGAGLEEISGFLHRRKSNPLSVPLDPSPECERVRLHEKRRLEPLIEADSAIVSAFAALSEKHGLDRPQQRGRRALRKFHSMLDRRKIDLIREARIRKAAPMLDDSLPLDYAAKLVREAACRMGIGAPKMSKERALAEGAQGVYDKLPAVQRRAADILAGSRVKPRKAWTVEGDARRIVDRVRAELAFRRGVGRPAGSSHLPRQHDDTKVWTRPAAMVKDKVAAALSVLEELTSRGRRDLFPMVRVSSLEFCAVLTCAGASGLDMQDRQDEVRVIARLIRASVRETRGP